MSVCGAIKRFVVKDHKLAIETSGVTVEQSVAEFARKVQPFLTEEDRRRMDGSVGYV